MFGVFTKNNIKKGKDIKLDITSLIGCDNWIPTILYKLVNIINVGIKAKPDLNSDKKDAIADFLILWYNILADTDIGKNTAPTEAALKANVPISITLSLFWNKYIISFAYTNPSAAIVEIRIVPKTVVKIKPFFTRV